MNYVHVLATPCVIDPRELQTIIETSLRNLFGDCHPHRGFKVIHCRSISKTSGKTNEAVVRCPEESTPSIRAALTFVTTPPHLRDTMYRFDCIGVGKTIDDVS